MLRERFTKCKVGLASIRSVQVGFCPTLIRGVLLPATMKLLGDWNWYLPRWLEWLPRVGPKRGAGPSQRAEPAASAEEPEREPIHA